MRGSGVKLLPVIVLLVIAEAYPVYVFQTGWSGGPGIPGPVTSWGTSFSEESNTAWDSSINDLFLGISSTQHVISTDLAGCKWAFPADMDGDGDQDVVSSSPLSPSYRVAWYENDGSGTGWSEHVISNNYAVIQCAYPADIDSDGDIDVIGANTAMSKNRIDWWRNEDGVGDSWTRFILSDNSPFFVCAADINADDTLEAIAPNDDSPYDISWWDAAYYPPDSVWVKHLVNNSNRYCEELVPFDLDQDGDLDILSARDYYDGLQWHENLDGLGLSWSKHQIGGYYDDAYSVHAADIDNDGDFDVVQCNSQKGQLNWFENLNGVGTSWEKHSIDYTLEKPRSVLLTDMQIDGRTDLIVADYGSYKLYYYQNVNSTGLEWTRYTLGSGSWFTDVDIADFNQDGRDDILAAASLGTCISWHELEGNTDGWLLSSILDVTSYPQWDSVTWIAEEPSGTDIFFQVRASNDWEDMGAWCDTLFEPQSLTGVIDSTFRYIQYRVGMTSDTEYLTPVLEEVRFYWTFLGIEGGEGSEEFSVSAYPNPSPGSVSIMIPPAFIPDAEILVYDISGKLVRRFTDLETNVVQWDCCDESGREVPSGIYIIQGISEDQSLNMRFVKI